jgi:hypothetical protein
MQICIRVSSLRSVRMDATRLTLVDDGSLKTGVIEEFRLNWKLDGDQPWESVLA